MNSLPGHLIELLGRVFFFFLMYPVFCSIKLFQGITYVHAPTHSLWQPHESICMPLHIATCACGALLPPVENHWFREIQIFHHHRVFLIRFFGESTINLDLQVYICPLKMWLPLVSGRSSFPGSALWMLYAL